MTNCSDSHVR